MYPVVIVKDRYGGVYSDGKWVAFNEPNVPENAQGSDTEASEFYHDYTKHYGKGDTPNEALKDLRRSNG